MEREAYRAKQHYQDPKVALQYDDLRFASWYGRLAHDNEARALRWAVQNYFQKPGKILDIPCGTGRLLPVLLEDGYLVVGGDVSQEMIKLSMERLGQESKVSFKIVDAEKMPFADDAFDYLTSYRLMCHLPRDVRRRVLSEMIRVTKKVLVINYHVKTVAPLYLFNRFFRKSTCPVSPFSFRELKQELTLRRDIEILAMRKLSWYERSSLLVVMRKRSG